MSPAFLPERKINKFKDDDGGGQYVDRRTYAIRRIHAFSYESSVLGVRPAMDQERHWSRRLIWAILVLGGIALATYQIQDRICRYFSFPTTTSVSVEQAVSLPFPQVTICNENRMMRSVAASLGKYTGLFIVFF